MPYGTPSAPQMTPQQGLDFLKNQAQALRGQLEEIESRIRELGGE
jgi:prefoldin subunit 5